MKNEITAVVLLVVVGVVAEVGVEVGVGVVVVVEVGVVVEVEVGVVVEVGVGGIVMTDTEISRRDQLERIAEIHRARGWPPLTEREKQRFMTYGTFAPNTIAPIDRALEVFRAEKKQQQKSRTRRRRR